MHVLFLWLHIYISGIFLLNYLVAILGTVYEEMLETGDFSYKVMKYQFIERYNIAFKDEWGFSELVIHPPPLNLTLSVLLPSVFT